VPSWTGPPNARGIADRRSPSLRGRASPHFPGGGRIRILGCSTRMGRRGPWSCDRRRAPERALSRTTTSHPGPRTTHTIMQIGWISPWRTICLVQRPAGPGSAGSPGCAIAGSREVTRLGASGPVGELVPWRGAESFSPARCSVAAEHIGGDSPAMIDDRPTGSATRPGLAALRATGLLDSLPRAVVRPADPACAPGCWGRGGPRLARRRGSAVLHELPGAARALGDPTPDVP
jgi:hypothetical protein